MTARPWARRSASPASACTSDAATTVCCGVSPVRPRGSRARRRRPCWSNSDTRSWRICSSAHALDEVRVGPGEPLDRRLVALVLRADLTRLRGGRGTRRGRARDGRTRSAICGRGAARRQREHGVVLRRRRGPRAERRRRRPSRPCARAGRRSPAWTIRPPLALRTRPEHASGRPDRRPPAARPLAVARVADVDRDVDRITRRAGGRHLLDAQRPARTGQHGEDDQRRRGRPGPGGGRPAARAAAAPCLRARRPRARPTGRAASR